VQKGFKKAAAIKGGLDAWEKAGGKVVRPSVPKPPTL
jgi:rhodanese-related sulfurtransferase